VAALSATWRAIQGHHPDVSGVVLILGSGTLGQRGTGRLGHFAQHRWHHSTPNTDAELHELFIGGEGLRAGAPSVLATLLHEAGCGEFWTGIRRQHVFVQATALSRWARGPVARHA
jgi:hypothetical protein